MFGVDQDPPLPEPVAESVDCCLEDAAVLHSYTGSTGWGRAQSVEERRFRSVWTRSAFLNPETKTSFLEKIS
ncbi:hypothetical protein EVAR_49729_1 [Eumeta japonica]|uniref:Uncharacterized protein n=1 Tax=Eumeta variegata TaxID=151549 RepID=A0A4C1ZU80_EUMVA|nr:hypothetical protein EVAR_49729_1 [Eumeta japonica]